MELEYIKVLIAQMFHFICGIFIIIYLKYQKQYTTLKNRANYYMGFSSTIYYSIDSYVYTIICTFILFILVVLMIYKMLMEEVYVD